MTQKDDDDDDDDDTADDDDDGSEDTGGDVLSGDRIGEDAASASEDAVPAAPRNTVPDGGDLSSEDGAIVPYDLSVNHLRRVRAAPGRPPAPPPPPRAASAHAAEEDFLPVVAPTDAVALRWRRRARDGSEARAAATPTAYRIEARRRAAGGAGGAGGATLWDSRKTPVARGRPPPSSRPWPAAAAPLRAGDVVEWRVTEWDGRDRARTSAWSKFAVGPADDADWRGRWIAHPADLETFRRAEEADPSSSECEAWQRRRGLPLFRARLSPAALAPDGNGDEDDDPLASALLVVSGLGSFRASLDGVPLSPSGPLDPPFTDYTRRVMYRGYDVTAFLTGAGAAGEEHVVGIAMGSGWWDHRPIVGGLVKFDLLPRGPATVAAQLYLTTARGKTRVALPTLAPAASGTPGWQAARGFVRESDLFVGEVVDAGVMAAMEGWDTSHGWRDAAPAEASSDPRAGWVAPVAYRTDVSSRQRKEDIAQRAGASESRGAERRAAPRHFAAPIGRRVPSEIPPVLPVEGLMPEEVRDLGAGRWLLDFGKAVSGMLHFDRGLPVPIVPAAYPRAHGFKAASRRGEAFVTVIYGDSLEMVSYQ